MTNPNIVCGVVAAIFQPKTTDDLDERSLQYIGEKNLFYYWRIEDSYERYKGQWIFLPFNNWIDFQIPEEDLYFTGEEVTLW